MLPSSKKVGPRGCHGDLRGSSRRNTMCQILYSWTDWGPERGRGLFNSECTEQGMGARVPDSFLCPLAARESWQSGLSPALVELVGNPLKKLICAHPLSQLCCLACLQPGKLLWSAFSLPWPTQETDSSLKSLAACQHPPPGYVCVGIE